MANEKYNFENFCLPAWKSRLSFTGGPHSGNPAPDFDLPTIHGGRFRLAEHRGPGPVLLEFSSLTCPLTLAARPALRRLYTEFSDRIRFLSVYIREAHPGELHPQPSNAAEKMQRARDWSVMDHIPWTIAVDTVAGEVHRAYGCSQRSLYLITASRDVAFRSLSSREDLLREKIARLLESAQETNVAPNFGVEDRIFNVLLDAFPSIAPAVSRGGEKAKTDFRRELGSVMDALRRLDESLRLGTPGADEPRAA